MSQPDEPLDTSPEANAGVVVLVASVAALIGAELVAR